MHDVAAYLVRRDHRLASEIRDLLETELAVGSVPELEELTTASAWLDRATSADGERARRLARLKIALDAALDEWLGDTGRQASAGTTARTGRRASAHEAAGFSGSSPVSSTRQARPR